jgi:DNA-binding CsgD family transcriptional regulator
MQWLLRHGAREFVFRSEVVAVGRGHDVDLNLDDESVSRRHAQLRHEHGRPLVEDLQSRNGTLVNGQLIAGRAFLSIGDLVAFGSCELELLRASDVVAFAPEQATGLIGRDEVARGVLGPLSPREREVFVQLAEGLSQRDIAEHFNVSVKTIETYRTRIGHKLGLRSRAELIRCALEAGILRPGRTSRSP